MGLKLIIYLLINQHQYFILQHSRYAVTETEIDLKDIIQKLNMVLIISLAEKGIQQKQIAKILGMSNKTISKTFGKNYDKLISKNHSD